jgi:hypothetical protein
VLVGVTVGGSNVIVGVTLTFTGVPDTGGLVRLSITDRKGGIK